MKAKYTEGHSFFASPMCRFVFIILFTLVLADCYLSSCTIVTMADGKSIFVGNNEDWADPHTKIWFYPPAAGEYGRVCFGFQTDFGFAQGGMNDQGLFLDANGLGPTGWKPDPAKPLFEDEINDYILAHCSSVEEVIDFFKKYSVFLGGGKFVFADANGESIVVEWAKGKDQIIRRTGLYQISTNFFQSSIVPGKVTDTRYNIADSILQNKETVSLDLIRSVLAATHQEWLTPTIYSYICDLKNLKVFVYNFHNFEEVYQFNLKEELKKGKKSYDLPALFKIKTFAAYAHETKSTRLANYELKRIIEKNGLEQAIQWYSDVKEKHWKVFDYYFNENLIQELGNNLLKENKNDQAVDVFIFNTHVFPDSASVWEALGDAYLKLGIQPKAIESFEKALLLNPQDDKLKKKIKN